MGVLSRAVRCAMILGLAASNNITKEVKRTKRIMMEEAKKRRSEITNLPV